MGRTARTPNDEQARLAALRAYKILDSQAEQGFDDIVQIASYICNTPIALVVLLDKDRQWFKAKVGLDANETPREHAFCAHAILEEGIFTVENALYDERFSDNPLVLSAPHIRFYAGAPLINPEGLAMGTLCVIDRTPRQLSPKQQDTLHALARQVVAQLELRKTTASLADTIAEIKVLQELLPICAWCKKIHTDEGSWQRIEDYLAMHTDIPLTHGICPSCSQKYFPEHEEHET